VSDKKDKVTDKAGEIAKNIWLAGVGAYGRAVDEAQGRLEKAGVETPKLFKDLVKAGAELEEEARNSLAGRRSAAGSVEERISRVRENFSLGRYVRGSELETLHQKIDQLSQQVAALSAALAAAGIVAPAPPKSGSRRAATKKARGKPATKTAAGRKSGAQARGKAKARRATTAKSATSKSKTTRKAAPRKAATSSKAR
jgi:polyhydroxyalkanoate synthesis regulator phasin